VKAEGAAGSAGRVDALLRGELVSGFGNTEGGIPRKYTACQLLCGYHSNEVGRH